MREKHRKTLFVEAVAKYNTGVILKAKQIIEEIIQEKQRPNHAHAVEYIARLEKKGKQLVVLRLPVLSRGPEGESFIDSPEISYNQLPKRCSTSLVNNSLKVTYRGEKVNISVKTANTTRTNYNGLVKDVKETLKGQQANSLNQLEILQLLEGISNSLFRFDGKRRLLSDKLMANLFFYLYGHEAPNLQLHGRREEDKFKQLNSYLERSYPASYPRETTEVYYEDLPSLKFFIIHDDDGKEVVEKVKERYKIIQGEGSLKETDAADLGENGDSTHQYEAVSVEPINLDVTLDVERFYRMLTNKSEENEVDALYVLATDGMLSKYFGYGKRRISFDTAICEWSRKHESVPVVVRSLNIVDENKVKYQFAELRPILKLRAGSEATGITALFNKALSRYRSLVAQRIKERRKKNILVTILAIGLGAVILTALLILVRANWKTSDRSSILSLYTNVEEIIRYPDCGSEPFYLGQDSKYLYVSSNFNSDPRISAHEWTVIKGTDNAKEVPRSPALSKTFGLSRSKDIIALKNSSLLISQGDKNAITILRNPTPSEPQNNSWEAENIGDQLPAKGNRKAGSDALAVNDQETLAITTLYRYDSIYTANLEKGKGKIYAFDSIPGMEPHSGSNGQPENATGVGFVTDSTFLLCFNGEFDGPKIYYFTIDADLRLSCQPVMGSETLSFLADIQLTANRSKFLVASDDNHSIYLGEVNYTAPNKLPEYPSENEGYRYRFFQGSPAHLSMHPKDSSLLMVAHKDHARVDMMKITKHNMHIVRSFGFPGLEQPLKDSIGSAAFFEVRGIAVNWESGVICVANTPTHQVYCWVDNPYFSRTVPNSKKIDSLDWRWWIK